MTASERKRRAQQTAAAMIARGSTRREVAAKVGRSVRQVTRWRRSDPEFIAAVDEIRQRLGLPDEVDTASHLPTGRRWRRLRRSAATATAA